MKTEKNLQDYLRRECLKRDISFDKVESRSRRGFPDVFMARGGVIILAELKSPAGTGKISALQERCIEDLIYHGVATFVIDSKAKADDVVACFPEDV